MQPYYHVGGERAEPPRGRKRAFEAGNEPSSRSSPSSVSSRSSGSRPSQPYRPSLIEPGDGGESARRTAGGGLAVPTTVSDRGGGAAPAQRRNLSPAHGNSPNTYQDIEGAQSEAASGEHAAAGGPAEPASLERDQLRYLFKHNPQLWLIQSLLKQLTPEEMWTQVTETPHSPTSGEGSVDRARGEPAARGEPTGPVTVGREVVELHRRSVATSRPRVVLTPQPIEVKWQCKVVLPAASWPRVVSPPSRSTIAYLPT